MEAIKLDQEEMAKAVAKMKELSGTMLADLEGTTAEAAFRVIHDTISAYGDGISQLSEVVDPRMCDAILIINESFQQVFLMLLLTGGGNPLTATAEPLDAEHQDPS